MHQLAITVGILISQCLSTPSLHLLGSEDLWQWLFFVPAVCGLAQIIVLPFCPESPSYLYMQGDLDGARRAIAKFQSEHVVEEYIGYIEEESKASQSGRSMTVSELFMDLTLRKQLIVGVVVQLMMQFSGESVNVWNAGISWSNLLLNAHSLFVALVLLAGIDAVFCK